MNRTKARPFVRNISQLPEVQYAQGDRKLTDGYLTEDTSPEGITFNQKHSLEAALKNIFPEQREETRLQKARQIMGEAIEDLTDQDLEGYLTEFQYLGDCWLDGFEESVFNNITLKQLLREA